MSVIEIRPITMKQAKRFVYHEHRHNDEPQGGAFCCALLRDGDLVGVGVAGRPISRVLQRQGQGLLLEITRCCVVEGVSNGCTRIRIGGFRRPNPWRELVRSARSPRC